MKRIAYLNIFCGKGGGGEVYLARLINEMQGISKNTNSFLITPNCEALNAVNTDIRQINGITQKSLIHNIFNLFLFIIQINRIIADLKPDTLIINGDRAIFFTPFIFSGCRKIGIKHMLIDSKLKALTFRFSSLFLDKIITISKFHVENYLSTTKDAKLKSKIKMIYNAVDIDHFKYKEHLVRERIIFTEIASLEERKGQMDLLKAFKNLLDKYSNIELWIVGAGPDESKILDYIHSNNLDNNIRLLGFRKDILNIINDSDIIVLPSYSEGFPLILLEAMSCSHPVISTDIAGIPEMYENNKEGFIISPGDIYELSAAMEVFIKKPEKIKEMGNLGHINVLNNFQNNTWVTQWNNIIYND